MDNSEPDTAAFEQQLRDAGERLYRLAGKAPPSLFDPHTLRGVLLKRAIADDALRTALFQMVDVLPVLDTPAGVAKHFGDYLNPHADRLGGLWKLLIACGAKSVAASAVRRSIMSLARRFVAEEAGSGLQYALSSIARIPAAVTVDAVGEAVVSEHEADRYASRYLGLLNSLSESRPVSSGMPSAHISIKLSALTADFDPLAEKAVQHRVFARIVPIIEQLQRLGGGMTVDMEQYEQKPMVLALFRALVERYGASGWFPGIALQAYLPETERDLLSLLEWADRIGCPISVRLVKGAYWDTEVAIAAQRGWPVPVFLDKAETDRHYERLIDLLFDHVGLVRPAIATHNLRSLAYAIAAAESRRLKPDQWEVQMLYGMAEPLRHAVARHGLKLRVYLPTGELIPGIAYLIRRLMENTADTSILRQTYLEGANVDRLLTPVIPVVRGLSRVPNAGGSSSEIPLSIAGRRGLARCEPAASLAFRAPDASLLRCGDGVDAVEAPVFSSLPLRDFSQPQVQVNFRSALERVKSSLGRPYPLMIEGMSAEGLRLIRSVNPANPEQIIGQAHAAEAPHAEQAIRNARDAAEGWGATTAAHRVRLCRRAADLIEARRDDWAAWEIMETGKNWREADADVAEAVDYLRYYAAQMESLAGWMPTRCFPGEENHLRYEPRGVAAVIAPWNFPLAILAGMTAAALVAGNTVIMKPATPAVIIACRFHALLLEAGYPPTACQILPGDGGTLGRALVSHPDVQLIAFTGSRQVGLEILRTAHDPVAGQSHVKQVVCEMGGKNAIIVDEDADLDEAVLHILHSAFGYQGQKCSAASRVIVVGNVHDCLIGRLAAALDSYAYGPPEDPVFLFGPLISAEAKEKAERYLAIGRREGKLAYLGKVPDGGYYHPPAVFAGIEPRHRLAQEEIFAPLLAVLRAPDFETALSMATDSQYALTGGVFSRLPSHLELARQRFRVGNLYLNRRITGARVGIQPFGGVRLSGTGIQAGGPDYLKQFLWTRVVSENTLRHGFVPPA